MGATAAQARAHHDMAEINTESGKYNLEERLVESLSDRLKSEQAANDVPYSDDLNPFPYQLGSEDDPHVPPEQYMRSELQKGYEIDLDDQNAEIENSVDVGSKTAAQVASEENSGEEKPKRKGEPEVPFPPDVPEPLALQAEKSDKRAFAAQTFAGVGDTVFVGVATVCVVGAIALVGTVMIVSRRLHRQYKSAEEADYPQYGVTGPIKDRGSPGDAKLASSAHLYHYQHTKQQIIAMEQSHMDRHENESEDESDVEGDEGDYSVYECPGLAPTGDIEVSNPLFDSNGDNQERVHQSSTEHREDQE